MLCRRRAAPTRRNQFALGGRQTWLRAIPAPSPRSSSPTAVLNDGREFLGLELTESVLMKHAGSTEAILKTLRARGVQLAGDDFGTGYSSLSYLRKVAIDSLKIDQSFVHQISATPEETSIVTAIISMCGSLNLRVVAEGVETRRNCFPASSSM